MTDHGYQAINDPYCYPGTTILRNKAGLQNQERLDEFEFLVTSNRFADALPSGQFNVSYYKSIHRHLFQDIFDWAGDYRTVRISKGGSMFCYPEFIESEMERLFSQLIQQVPEAPMTMQVYGKVIASFLMELNAIHPFRDGNGRTQLTFLTTFSAKFGYLFLLDETEPATFLQAMIDSFKGNVAPLETAVIANLKRIQS